MSETTMFEKLKDEVTIAELLRCADIAADLASDQLKDCEVESATGNFEAGSKLIKALQAIDKVLVEYDYLDIVKNHQ